MDEIRTCLEEMHQNAESFKRNNQLLKDNWKDKKSDQFSSTCITVVHGNCQEYMQTIEQLHNGINTSLEELENLVKELAREIDMQSYAYNLKLDGKISG